VTELDDAKADFTHGYHNDGIRLRRLAAAIIAEARKPAPTFCTFKLIGVPGVCGRPLPCADHSPVLVQKKGEDHLTCVVCGARVAPNERHDYPGECPGKQAPPSDATKAWRERMLEWVPLERDTGRTEHDATKVVDEAVALITAAEQQLFAARNDLLREGMERDAAVKRAEAAEDLGRKVLNQYEQSTKDHEDAFGRAQDDRIALRTERDTAQKQRDNLALARDVMQEQRDDLRARLAKLLAALELYYSGGSGYDLRTAFAEARSGATDAPQAKDAT
jgi:hypothetical protein